MKRNMNVKTMALVLATITGMQATGISSKFTGVENKAYASTSVDANNQNAESSAQDRTDSIYIEGNRNQMMATTATTSPQAVKVSVSISGTERVGKTLDTKVTASIDGKSVSQSDMKIEYQWQRSKHKDDDYSDISGEHDDDYKLVSRDEDKYIKVIAKVTINGTTIEASDRTSSIDEKRSSDSSSSSSEGSGTTADTDAITDKLDNSNADRISYDISDYPKVEKEVFEALEDNDDKILELKGDNCTWTFDGDDINNLSAMGSRLDTTIETTSPNASEISSLINGTSVVNLYFKNEGALPGKATVEVNIGSKYDGKNMYVYYYNKSTKSFELVDSNVKVDDGKIKFKISHCSDYVLSEVSLSASSGILNGWKLSNNGEWEFVSYGNKLTGWNIINSRWYYMDSLGKMQTGWINTNNSWYYLNYSGDMATGWNQIGNSWYFLNDGGKMETGWIDDRGTWYYMYSNGAMACNTKIDGYRLGTSGAWIR